MPIPMGLIGLGIAIAIGIEGTVVGSDGIVDTDTEPDTDAGGSA
jgi:hypothetical protein